MLERLKSLFRAWIVTNHCLLYYIFFRKRFKMLSVDYEKYHEAYLNSEETKFDGSLDDTSLIFRLMSVRVAVARTLKERIKRLLGKSERLSVLDVGCGDGAILKYLRSELPIDCSGVDISPLAVQMLNDTGLIPSTVIDCSDPVALTENLDVYDVIIMTEFIEHIPNSEEILAALNHHYKQALYVSLPNTGYYFERLRLLLGKFPVQWRFHPAEHLRYFTVSDFKWTLEQLDCKRYKCIPYYGIPFLRELWPNLFARYVLFEIQK